MKTKIGLLLIAIAVGIGVSSCDAADKLCGPCGDVYAGDDFISGDAKLDGLFKAVGSFGMATASIDASFKADVLALGEVFGVAEADMEGLAIGDLVALVKAKIQADISGAVSGELKVVFVEPKCSASVDVAVEAQANCEASAGCEISAECEAGELAVSCEGTCSGGCTGVCEGGCKLEASGVCEGKCEGSCNLEAGGDCNGTCKGDCDVACSAHDAEGNCDGTCDGECKGTCELAVAAECDGECHGKCEVEINAECGGECHGDCKAECSGSCEGTVEPLECSAEGSCDASADCQASASAQASASLECTPPQLDIRFSFDASLDADAKAEFSAKMAELKVRMVGIIQGMFKMRALIDVDYAASIGFDPPIAQITGQVDGMIHADLGDFDIPAGRLTCVLPAFEDSFEIMEGAVTTMGATLQAQVEIVGVLDIL